MVTHQSTKQAQHSLTSVIRWEPVHSVWYGRRHNPHCNNMPLFSLHSVKRSTLFVTDTTLGPLQLVFSCLCLTSGDSATLLIQQRCSCTRVCKCMWEYCSHYIMWDPSPLSFFFFFEIHLLIYSVILYEISIQLLLHGTNRFTEHVYDTFNVFNGYVIRTYKKIVCVLHMTLLSLHTCISALPLLQT